MKLKATALILVCLGLGFISGVFYSRHNLRERMQRQELDIEGMVKRLGRSLELKPEQRKQFRAMVEARRPGLKQQRDEARLRLRQEVDNLFLELENILDEPQKVKLQRHRAQLQKRARPKEPAESQADTAVTTLVKP